MLQVKGEAEAYAIEAKAKAEAEQMAKKADAWKEYREAAMVDMVLETMPKVFLISVAIFYLISPFCTINLLKVGFRMPRRREKNI